MDEPLKRRGRPRKAQVDPIDVEELRNDVKLLEQFEADCKNEFGKRLLKLLDDSIDDTTKRFISDQLDTLDMNKAIFFLASCRSKLQTLIALKDKYLNAGKEKLELIEELKKLTQEVT